MTYQDSPDKSFRSIIEPSQTKGIDFNRDKASSQLLNYEIHSPEFKAKNKKNASNLEIYPQELTLPALSSA